MEGRTSCGVVHEQSQFFPRQKRSSFAGTGGSFARFSSLQAEVAYAESLAAVEYLRDRYGLREISRMVESIGTGDSSEQALRNSTGLDYSGLERRLAEYLAR
jgi:hypothetical protein